MEPRHRSASAGSGRSAASRASSGSAMGPDGGEAGWRAAQEEELMRREMADASSFCNNFWGFNDAGFPVVQNRVKGASRVLEELRSMYRERAEIEADYAKRLAKLSRQPLGRDETGAMRSALDVVRNETELMAQSHSDLSQVFKKELEGAAHEFLTRTNNQRRPSVTSIERLYKQKMTQESYVNKSREKYEQDCFRINGYTAQSSLVQGRDLDKVTNKLDKAQASVSANEKDYQNFVRALKDTTLRWNAEWKSYLDECQDMEEERLEFLKASLWSYANSISSTCVSDDMSCERVRVALESCEAPRDIMDFIHHAGTGNTIPDPPEFIDYSRGKPPPPRPSYRSANFQRSSTRPVMDVPPAAVPESASVAEIPKRRSGGPMNQNEAPTSKPLPEQLSDDSAQQTSQRDAKDDYDPHSFSSGASVPQRNGRKGDMGASASEGTIGDQTIVIGTPTKDASSHRVAQAKSFQAQTSSRGMPPLDAARSSNADSRPRVDSSASAMSSKMPPSSTASTVQSGTEDDPISKALAELRMKPARSTMSAASTGPPTPSKGGAPSSAGPVRQSGQSNPPASYFASDDSRPRSPSAAFMQEPQRAASPLPVEDVVSHYGQSFPGEHRSLSRQNSTASRQSHNSVQAPVSQQRPPQERARSPGPSQGGPQGFAGVGARGRSPSPQPFQQRPNRSQQASMQGPPQQGARSGGPGQSSAAPFIAPQRSTTPLGISLDASGSVTHDQMADDFMRRSGSVQPNQGRPRSMVSPPTQQTQQQQQHSYMEGQPPRSPSRQQGPPPQSFSPHPSQGGQYRGAQGVGPAAPSYPYSQPQTAVQGQLPVYNASPHQHPPTQIPTAPPPSQYAQQPGSFGRQSGQNGYSSPYNQRPASAIGPSASQFGQQPHQATPGYTSPSRQPQPLQETPASAYMHQYQQQQQQQQQQQHNAAPPASFAQAQPQPYSQAPHPQTWQSWNTPQTNAYPSAQPGANGHGSAPAYVQHSQPQQQQQRQPSATQAPPPQPAAPAAAPAPPTGQFSETGKPILFYVKALYDYHAQLDEEFSFTAGDIIAVWETSPDGWWQGELLDDMRRRPGSNTFPSNFVSLLN